MAEIARKVGVSRPTVSYVLNQRNTGIKVTDATRERILQIAKEHAYHRNDVARAIATGKTRVVGYLSNSLSTEYLGLMLDGALRVAQAKRYFVKVLSEIGGIDLASVCIELRLEGVICAQFPEAKVDHLFELLAPHRIPVLILDQNARPWATSVASDDAQGMRLMVEHLVGSGHTRIAFIGGNPMRTGAVLRRTTFAEALAARGWPVPEDFMLCGNWIASDTERAARRLLEREDRPSAIVCASDPMALVALRVAHTLGIRVPEDLSVTGYGDLAMAQYATPALTTVAQPFEAMGQKAMENLLNALEEKRPPFPAPPQRITVPTRLVVRSSTGPAPRNPESQ